MSSYTFVDTYEVEGLENKILELKITQSLSHISYISLLCVIYDNEYYYCTKFTGSQKLTHLILTKITLHKDDETNVYDNRIHVRCHMSFYTLTRADIVSKELADAYETYCGNNEYILK